MWTSRLLLLLLGIAVQMVAPSDAQAQYDFAIQGVADSDVLNIRERIEGADDVTSTRVVGRIPADARDVAGTGLTVMVGESRWHEIVFQGVKGWVNGRFLKKIESGKDIEPPVFACSGTEPFWSIELGRSEATFKNPFGAKGEEVRRYDVTQRRRARGRSHIQVVSLRNKVDKLMRSVAVLKRDDTCSDGMSDFTYPYEVILSIGDDTDPDAGGVRHGCCTLVR